MVDLMVVAMWSLTGDVSSLPLAYCFEAEELVPMCCLEVEEIHAS